MVVLLAVVMAVDTELAAADADATKVSQSIPMPLYGSAAELAGRAWPNRY